MNAPDCIGIDFETEAIQSRPAYPPVPVGVAIKLPRQPSHYYAWGHPTLNNCTFSAGMTALSCAWSSGLPLLFHHAKFDLAVATEKLRLPPVPWERVHDTTYLAFLADPHARKHDLKSLAADLLQWPAEERDELRAWIWEHRQQLEQAYGGKVNPKDNAEWIAYAPGDIVGKYACGDIDRTWGLFEHLWPVIQDNGMGTAYDRERRLLPIFMENERIGMRVDLEGLQRDVAAYHEHMFHVEQWLRAELRSPNLNIDADKEVAQALLSCGVVPAENWSLTAGRKGKDGRIIPGSQQLRTAKDALLPAHFSGPNGAQIASALGYRNRLKTCLTMFMEPWLAQASQRNGHVSTNWNQTRGDDGGTRTGRPSTSDPNFLNISKNFEGRPDGYIHPDFLGVSPLPLVRRYVLPDDGGVFLHRDFDGQELRVFADFECGALQAEYKRDPATDPHTFVGKELAPLAWGEPYDNNKHRTNTKGMNFKGIYGGGAPSIAAQLGVSLAEAKKFKAFHEQALPGIKVLNSVIKAVVARGEPIRTWGGRLYFPEPPSYSEKFKRQMTYEYKLINYLIQGSAADITKEALCQWYEGGGATTGARFLVTVYDEINISGGINCPWQEDMAWLREVMEQDWLDIKMLSSGKQGPNWGTLEKCA